MALQQQNTASTNTSAERLINVEMALEALRNVIRNNAGLYEKCIWIKHANAEWLCLLSKIFQIFRSINNCDHLYVCLSACLPVCPHLLTTYPYIRFTSELQLILHHDKRLNSF